MAEEQLASLTRSPFLAPVPAVRLTTLRAGVAAGRGDTDAALADYRAALRAWTDFGLLWEVAMTGFDMAMLLDPALPDVRAVAARSRELFARMGAARVLEMLDTRTGAAGAATTAAPPVADALAADPA
jgi:hypothetical protein